MLQTRGVRRAVAAPFLAVAVIAASLTACTSGAEDDAGTDDPAGAGTGRSAAPAPPGRHSTLPEPCGSVAPSLLKRLVPGAEDYDGEARLTYDTDRRAGCKWSGRNSAADHYLSVDFERVVSYDTAVSDDDQAQQEFLALATGAGIPDLPSAAPAGRSGEAKAGDGGTDDGTPDAGNSPADEDPSADPSASDPAADGTGAPGASSRLLGGIGDAAFVHDRLTARGTGTHRDVTLVFRTSNVLVTVEYSQWPLDRSVVPAGGALQLRARSVAAELVEQFGD
ncbi:hypothetical protein ACFV1B_11430 [Streptomyces sp. NPDC059637]|uniref:hypothetical protein n=1 Tax=Streptomyces sp. NPDC059637 TaxID=3347752 RepID=UPI0036B5F212